MPASLSNLLKSLDGGLVMLLLIAIVVGVFIGNDYGMGADEFENAEVGTRALSTWVSPDGFRKYLRSGEPIAHHGPSYFMAFVAFSKFFTSIFNGWHLADSRHLTNYLTFLLGVAFFYSICTRLLPRRTALVTSAVFATQPVLFGLGFINQKDTPFMVFFMASLVAGFWVTERWEKADDSSDTRPSSGAPISLWQITRRDWAAAQLWRKLILIFTGVLFVVVVLDLLIFDNLLQALKSVMRLAYEGRAWEPINWLFTLGAEDAYKTAVEAYLPKLSWGYWFLGRMPILVLSLVGV